jgi:hypothetical protein
LRDSIDHLLITGGIYHDFDATAAAFAAALEPLGVRTRITSDVESALRDLNTGTCDLLTVDALRFTMTQHEKYAPLREQWAFEPSPWARESLAGYVREGGALLGLHTASICFDGWDEWPKILGAGWVWGRSSHPPVGAVRVERAVEGDSIVGQSPPFEVVDEVYRGMELFSHSRPLLHAKAESDTEFHPVMWTHRYGAGRVVYDALGHGPDSITEPTHLAILKRAVQWLIEPGQLNDKEAGGTGHA